ncbi:hypothetical protein CC1G_12425 [Coprinopsis cinerea okayama7|uniref:Neutral protease 2 n=1 Tax=Coprinopsis cinerea (strain Okayama-7 / 130 / ATCC MYA-4618 / FGSC 9003) TaxID=240176 RepID=A8P6G8_COPC7|nr:hypothetical protein CC1G_12425 [Coprinopsis cinerea okayama7\|eukprot:XP_001839153.2 hypothetical protein CC1G_12425 [Coprinopsis cinerea okayama7\
MVFEHLLVLFSFLLAVSAFPFDKRANDLEVVLTTQTSRVASIEDIEITAAVTNNGAETLKLLKYATILDGDLPTSSFTITKDRRPVPFLGVKLSISLSDLDDSAFVTIGAGETVTIVHSGLAALYDFASVGTGSFSFEPRINIVKADEDDVRVSSFSDLTVGTSSVTVDVTDDVARRVLGGLNLVEKRARNVVSESRTLATAASSYVNSRGTSDSLYVAYWGTNAASRVTSVFNAVANENSSSRTLDCVDQYGVCGGGTIAYTVIATTNIYYCSIFFNQVSISQLCGGTTVAARNVRGGTTLHELTHAVARTDDVAYGCAADQRLSTSQKIINADNYNVLRAWYSLKVRATYDETMRGISVGRGLYVTSCCTKGALICFRGVSTIYELSDQFGEAKASPSRAMFLPPQASLGYKAVTYNHWHDAFSMTPVRTCQTSNTRGVLKEGSTIPFLHHKPDPTPTPATAQRKESTITYPKRRNK